MYPQNREKIRQRVVRAAEAALAHHKYVSAIDVFVGMEALTMTDVDAWRKGRIDYLERMIHGNLKKISAAMAEFRRWAAAKGLKPSETAYVRKCSGRPDLRFSKRGHPVIERLYRTHYVSRALSTDKHVSQPAAAERC